MSRALRPIGERVLVQRDAPVKQLASGLYVPEASQSDEPRGTIVAVGADVELVSVGERVMFGKHAGQEVEFDKQKYLVLREEDIIAVLTGDE